MFDTFLKTFPFPQTLTVFQLPVAGTWLIFQLADKNRTKPETNLTGCLQIEELKDHLVNHIFSATGFVTILYGEIEFNLIRKYMSQYMVLFSRSKIK